MRTALYILIGVFTFLVQALLLPRLFHTNWQPDLFLAWVVILSLLRGRRIGIAVAIIAGLVQDILVSNLFGLHFFPYIVVAYICSIWTHTVYEEKWYVSFFWVVAVTIVVSIMQFCMLWLGRADVQLLGFVWYHTWPALWLNGLLGIGLHEFVWNLTEEDEYIW